MFVVGGESLIDLKEKPLKGGVMSLTAQLENAYVPGALPQALAYIHLALAYKWLMTAGRSAG